MPLGKSPILLSDLMAEGDSNKHILFNDFVTKIEDSVNRQSTVDLSGGNLTLTETQILAHGVILFTSAASSTTVTVPPTINGGANTTNRVFIARNISGFDVILTHGSGATVTLNTGTSALVFANGTDVVSLAGVSAPGTVSASDEGTLVLSNLTDFNFAGDNVAVTDDGDGTVTITVTQAAPDPAETKTAYESNADTNAFTDAEKSKLAALDDSLFLGTFTNLSALQTAHPSPAVGSYAHVDAGAAADIVLYIWDDTDSAYVLASGTGTSETASSIKTKYESNPDTNAFTDALLSKLNAIETGATADQNAAEIESLLDTYYGGTSWRTGGGGGGSVAVQDESIEITGTASLLDFVGDGVTVTDNGGGSVTITIPGGGGGAGTINSIRLPDVSANTDDGVTSATNAATKGNRVRPFFDVSVSSLQMAISGGSVGDYEAVVATNVAGTVGTVVARETVTASSGSEILTFNFSPAADLTAGEDYFILLTDKTGTGTTQLASVAGSDTLSGDFSFTDLGGYIEDNDIQGGESLTSFNSSHLFQSLVYSKSVEVTGEINTVLNGTVDPVAADGDDGDFWINSATLTLFGPKAAGAWPVGVNLPATTNNFLTVMDSYLTDTSSAESTSAFASKGNIITVNEDRYLYSASLFSGTASQTVKAVIAELSEVNPGTITQLLAESSPITTVNSATVQPLVFPDLVLLEAGKFYGVIYVRTDGTSTTPLGVAFPSATANPDVDGYVNVEASVRYASNDPLVSDNIWFASDSHVVSRFDTLPVSAGELISELSAAQIEARLDAYYGGTSWRTGGAGSGTTQSELTAAHTVTNADLVGNVMRRVNTASAVDVTVNSGLTGTEPVTFIQKGAGQVTFVAGAGVTINSADGNSKTRVQYSSATLVPDSDTADTYYLIGDLTT